MKNMKKLFSLILVPSLLWCNFGFSETAKEAATKSLGNRMYFALESLIFGLIFCIITFIFVKFMKSFFKKDVAYKDIYIHAFFAGIAIKVILLILLK